MAPIPELVQEVNNYINNNNVMIFSKTTCPFCNKVKALISSLGVQFTALELDTLENGPELQKAMAAKVGRSTVPQVFIRGQHVGGCDDTFAAHCSGKLQEMLFREEEKYDYDLIVIGGGSGGLAASKEAARLGKKVAVLDFVTPTPVGTTWGLGGTCVNVGCIPKKLMHQAAILGQSIKDAKSYGWSYEDKVEHNWVVMRENVQNYIGSLNWNYKVQLRTEQVKYINAYGQFVEDHKIKAVDKKGKETLMSSKHFIIATGERPRYPDIEGAKEYGITSDDVFSLEKSPGKTLVIGASYVALECAGFLKGIGLDVTVMVRSILLRGFDQDMAERIGSYMQSEGINFIRPCVPKKVEKIESGEHKLKVTGIMQSGEEVVGEYDTVLFAIGRDACTNNIGLDKVGVQINTKNGKLPVVNEQTNVPYIYAIGDVLEGKPELTPVAIEAGQLLARRLYADSVIQCDYDFIPTTVFTPLEYGSIGYSEENAIEKYGEDQIEIYHSNITPLEWTIAKRETNACYVKLICLIPEKERVIGFHYLGPNAGEVTQGFALGIKLGATKADFDATIGIHPTCAEIFTTLSVTKRSGKSTEQSGC
ncbi:thioredoxin reductase 1, cytoplasmic-like isoform X1 [Argiope bruennichi]|uniref:thioredoxin reductase 1, cytoplasmic-like isoform X1 n=1 Tax=Argiope bruennichi TaxID=94029 RepID=UPI0024957C75|nr:thioredoxin reductase 1, cytoplasmic-like isoform X1 [Argiope bruennichi]